MSLNFPYIPSSNEDVSSYCNFIEYSCFCYDYIEFSEFDTSELKLEDIKQELKRRLNLYGDFTPFEIKKDQIISLINKKEDFLQYFYCLYYSLKGGNSKSFNTNIFELITDNSLKSYFNTSRSKITSIGLNSENLINCIDSIRMDLYEKKGSIEELSVHAKDGGIDIITYIPVDDRGNQIVCLTDATIGKNWRKEKKVTSKLNYWTKFIHFKVSPITCLSIVHITKDGEFFQASMDNGLIFDRARIMKFYRNDDNLKETLKGWLKTI